jgi:hypothetical protein
VIVLARVPCAGVRPGSKIDAANAPVRDPSLADPVGRITGARCVEPDWLEITMELDESAVAARLRERRGAF